MAKKRSSSKMADHASPPASFKYEVILWAVLAVSVILFISSFGIAGKAGDFISSVLFGLFGFTAYIFPFLLFGGTAFVIANKDNTAAVMKEAAAAGFFIFVCMFLELIGGDPQAQNPADSYIWASQHKFGGGLAGGILTWLIKPHLGTVSAFVIDIVMLIICMVLITQRSLWKPIQSGGKKMYATAKRETIRQHEQYTQRRQRRMDNKVIGVSADTSIKNAVKQAVSDNLNEIRPDTALMPDFPIHMMNQNQQTSSAKTPQQVQRAKEEMPQSQAVGMEYADVTQFQVHTKAKQEVQDKIVPIKNKKVALKPSLPSDEAADDAVSLKNDTDAFFDHTASIFSELMPAAETGAGMPAASETGWKVQENMMPQMPEAVQEAPGHTSAMNADLSISNSNGEEPEEELNFDSMDFFGIDLQELQTNQDAGGSLAQDMAQAQGGGLSLSLSQHPSAGLMQDADLDAGTGYASAAGHGLQSYADTEHDLDTWQEEGLDTGAADGYDISRDMEPESDAAAVTAEELIAQQLMTAKTASVKTAVPAVRASETGSRPGSVQHKNPKQSEAGIASSTADIDVQLHKPQPVVRREYILPSPELLKRADPNQTGDSREHLQETAFKLQQTLKNFGVNVTILNVSCGPSVTRYEIQPEMGVKVSKIVNLADDIKLNLAAADIRIEAPIPGKAAIGIEVPNKETVPVMFRELVESEAFKKHPSPCAFAAGKDIAGQTVVTDICKMPHVLIAGATGSGKSVCINTIIMSIIYKANPDDVKLIMIDPKVVELSVYNGIPHLLLPVVTDPKKAAGALHWAVSEMMDRYQKFADYGVRDMKGYNAKVKKIADIPEEDKPQKMPYIVIIVDELADLMMAAPGDVEDAICRLAQLARAAGIHLIIATQRPSVNVITGLIKANMPSRIAFSVTSGIDSRTILDMNGAEKLLGKGDMLFYPQGLPKPVRMQGAFVSDSEVSDVVEFLTAQNGAPGYSSEIQEKVASAAVSAGSPSADSSSGDERDVYFADAARLLMDKEKASVSMLQRYFKIGFNRAARIMDQLEEAGVVGPEEGTKPRKIMMSPEKFAQYEEEVL